MISTKKLTRLILAAAVAASTGTAWANESSSLSVDVNYWRPSLTSDSNMHMPNSATVDLKGDLGLDKKNLLNLTLNFKSGERTTWYAGIEEMKFSNSRTLSKNFRFNNSNYSVGDRTNSELKLSHTQIGVRNGKVKNNNMFYTNVQVNRLGVKTTIANNTTGASQNRDQSFTTLGFGLGWETANPNQVNYFAEINPLSTGNGGYWEHKLGIKAPVGKNAKLTLGYKFAEYLTGKDSDNDRTRVDLRGPYFSLGGNF